MKKMLSRLTQLCGCAALLCALLTFHAYAAESEYFMTGYPMWPEGETVSATDGDFSTCAVSDAPLTDDRSFGLRFAHPIEVRGFHVLTGLDNEIEALGEAVLEYRCAEETDYCEIENGVFSGSQVWSFAAQPLEDVTEIRVRVLDPPFEEDFGLRLREIACFEPELAPKGAECSVILDGVALLSGSPDALTDGDPYTSVRLASPGQDTVSAGSTITLDFGMLTELGWVDILQGLFEGDEYRMDAALEASTDGMQYTLLTDDLDALPDLAATPLCTRYLRLRCLTDSSRPVNLRTFAAGLSEDGTPADTNAEALRGLRVHMTDGAAALTPNCTFSLRPGEYLGFTLPGTRMVTGWSLDAEGGLPELRAGFHPHELAVPATDGSFPARYFRLVNDGALDLTFTLRALRVSFLPELDASVSGSPAAEGHPLDALLDGDPQTYYEPLEHTGAITVLLSETTDETRSLTVLQDNGDAAVAITARAAGSAEFHMLGTLDDAPACFDLSTLPAAAELRLTWHGGAPKLYDIALDKESRTADRQALRDVIARAGQRNDASLRAPLSEAREALQNPFLTQPAIDRAADTLRQALDALDSGSGGDAPVSHKADAPTSPLPTAVRLAEVSVSSGKDATVEVVLTQPARVTIPVSQPAPSLAVYRVEPDGSETLLRGAALSDGALIVVLDGSAVLRIRDNAVPFDDAPQDPVMADAIQFSASRKLFLGTGTQTFSPDEPMTHAMLVTVLHRLANEPAAAISPPSGVPAGAYFESAAAWAAATGLVDRTAFRADEPVTAAALAETLQRFASIQADGNGAAYEAALRRLLPTDTPFGQPMTRAQTACAIRALITALATGASAP